ncbi:MAG: glycosyltransferase [Bacteroidota bacterium]
MNKNSDFLSWIKAAKAHIDPYGYTWYKGFQVVTAVRSSILKPPSDRITNNGYLHVRVCNNLERTRPACLNLKVKIERGNIRWKKEWPDGLEERLVINSLQQLSYSAEFLVKKDGYERLITRPFPNEKNALSQFLCLKRKMKKVKGSVQILKIKKQIDESIAKPKKDKGILNILCIGSEWFSRHGGLTSFNRQFCVEIAKQKQKVICLVPSCSQEEIENAENQNVLLIQAAKSPGYKGLKRLGLPPLLPENFYPNIIVGHDRITGPPMIALKNTCFPDAKSIMFIHTVPSEIEMYKKVNEYSHFTKTEIADKKEELQIDLANACDFVVAVGPYLYEQISTQLAGFSRHPRAIQFDPGLINYQATPFAEKPLPFCMFFGRVDDYELKGIDIAARALGIIVGNKNYKGKEPIFIIRGVEKGRGDELRGKVKTDSKSDLRIRVKNFTDNNISLLEDIRRASLIMMPSREEGFGLVGLEAISMSCPVLISDQSGLAKLIQSIAPDEARHWIVPVTGDLEKDSKEWAIKIQYILDDIEAAIRRMEKLVNIFSEKITWEQSIQKMLSEITS